MDDFDRAFKRIRAIAKQKNWPGVEEGQSWGTPSLKVKGKMLFRVREPGVGVLMCRLEAKEMLLQVAPHIYFDLPHYKGYPAVLIHLDQIEDDEIAEMIEEYWRKIAPKKLISEYDARTSATSDASASRKQGNKKLSKTHSKTAKPATRRPSRRRAGSKP